MLQPARATSTRRVAYQSPASTVAGIDQRRANGHHLRSEIMRVRIVVADRSEARFYDAVAPRALLQPAGGLCDPQARLHDRDLESDRPGRLFSSARGADGRGAIARHGAGGERTAHKEGAQRFAKLIGKELDAQRALGSFDRIVLMAGPSFLGALRTALSKSVRHEVVAEVNLDLVHQSESRIREELPPEVFSSWDRS